MIQQALVDLWYGFGVALEPHNLLWCFVGVLIGNMVGVLPGMGPLATISILLPLTFGMKPVAAILMIAGVYYGAQYGGAICSILLNLPCHPPHAVTCLDGFPMTKQGKGGVALGVTVIGSFIGASWGITEMIFLAPLLVSVALKFGPAEVCSLMLLGLLAGSTLARGSPLKGIAMTVLGLLIGVVGSDIETGAPRLTFGSDRPDRRHRNCRARARPVRHRGIHAEHQSDRRDRHEVFERQAARHAAFQGRTEAGLPGDDPRHPDRQPVRADSRHGPTIASFVAYATEKKISKTPERFGHGAIEGVACPEASTHSSVQGDFIPTMSLGIPGDAVMALLLGALIIQGIVPGPQLIKEHPDIFWGLIASFWIGNILLVILNVPMIGLWVKLLMIPYKYLYPSALFFVCIGVYSTNNDMFQVGEVLVIGVVGYVLNLLGFHPAPILLGFVLGPRVEENFRRAMLISRGDLLTFVERPISAFFVALSVLLIGAQIYVWLRGRKVELVPDVHVGLKPLEQNDPNPTAPQAGARVAAE